MLRAFFHVVLALSALTLGLELVMRLLPVSTATLVADHLQAGIPTVPPHHRWTMATGWDLRNAQTLQANAQGFAAEHDFQPNPQAVALVGDSFVEASMLRAEDRLGPQLERHLQGRPVYAMGSPGSSLLDYGHRLQWAQRSFQIRDAVVFMERADVSQSRCGSGNTVSLCWNPKRDAVEPVTTAAPGPVKRLLRHSALAQYLASQLRVDARRLWANALAQAEPAQGHDVGKRSSTPAPAQAPTPLSAEQRAEIARIAGLFFEQVKDLPGRLVLVIDADREALRRSQAGSNPARDHFIALARARGITVVDLAPTFEAHLRQSPLALEVGPYDAHLNALALSLVATAAAAPFTTTAP